MSTKTSDDEPMIVNLEKNKTYDWCTCGLSKNQPFADESCQDPLSFQPEKDGPASLCMCKRTKTPPYCDGSHLDLAKNDNVQNQTNSGESNLTIGIIKDLAANGLPTKHGRVDAMGVPLGTLPQWNDIQILSAQLASKPLEEDAEVKTKFVIGPKAKKPLVMDMPIYVSDISFGALSKEAKIALAKGAEKVGTGIASGEGGMLAQEQEQNSKYFYELASGLFGFDWDKIKKVQAFHFKGGQGAKTGTGGHLPGEKVTEEIAQVRNLNPGEDAISPATFKDLHSVEDFKKFADEIRKISGGIPIGFKLSANHIEQDINFALQAGADYIIIDGRGGSTGAAPTLFRDNISVPIIPALARARKFIDQSGKKDVTLIATGGLRVADDFIKALCLGADGIAIASSAMQAIGCDNARACNTNRCHKGIATQDEKLRSQIDVEKSANQLANFLSASNDLIKVMARACGHDDINKFNTNDITTWKKEISDLTGIHFAGNSVSSDKKVFTSQKNLFSLEKFNKELLSRKNKKEIKNNKKQENKMEKYKCLACGHVYDPAKGDPENGIAPGTAFEDLPDNWTCPGCGVPKSMFGKIS